MFLWCPCSCLIGLASIHVLPCCCCGCVIYCAYFPIRLRSRTCLILFVYLFFRLYRLVLAGTHPLPTPLSKYSTQFGSQVPISVPLFGTTKFNCDIVLARSQHSGLNWRFSCFVRNIIHCSLINPSCLRIQKLFGNLSIGPPSTVITGSTFYAIFSA